MPNAWETYLLRNTTHVPALADLIGLLGTIMFVPTTIWVGVNYGLLSVPTAGLSLLFLAIGSAALLAFRRTSFQASVRKEKLAFFEKWKLPDAEIYLSPLFLRDNVRLASLPPGGHCLFIQGRSAFVLGKDADGKWRAEKVSRRKPRSILELREKGLLWREASVKVYTPASSIAGRALVGGAIAGRTGALVGSMTAPQQAKILTPLDTRRRVVSTWELVFDTAAGEERSLNLAPGVGVRFPAREVHESARYVVQEENRLSAFLGKWPSQPQQRATSSTKPHFDNWF